MGSIKKGTIKRFVIILLLIFSTSIFAKGDVFKETQDKLDLISDEEKGAIETLYKLDQEIRENQRKEADISNEIKGIEDEVEELELRILEEESSYNKNRDVLREVLKSYQKMGPASFLEILLNSDSLGGFLKRLNAIRDLSRNTEKLMVSLDENKMQMEIQREGLNKRFFSLEERQAELKSLLEEGNKQKARQEAYLASLEGERSTYQEALNEINRAWEELKPMFSLATSEFTRLAQEGNLPPQAVHMTNVRLKVKATIKEEDFNKIISDNVNLPFVEFEFHQGRIELRIPDLKLVLFGNYGVEGVNTLKFLVEEGNFYGLPLEKTSLEELFEDGDLLLKLETLIGRSKVETVESKKGELVLIVKPFF